jgi:hypothetical protein
VWCVDIDHVVGIYRGGWDLHRLGEVGLAPCGGQAAKPRRQPTGWSGLHRLSPPTWPSPPHVDTSQPRPGLNRVNLGRPTKELGRPSPGPNRPGVWPTCSTFQIHPRGYDDIDIWLTSLCHPLKCSNLAPKFLKSNKH